MHQVSYWIYPQYTPCFLRYTDVSVLCVLQWCAPGVLCIFCYTLLCSSVIIQLLKTFFLNNSNNNNQCISRSKYDDFAIVISMILFVVSSSPVACAVRILAGGVLYSDHNSSDPPFYPLWTDQSASHISIQ